MSQSIPAAQALVDRYLAAIESALGQTTPPADKAYNKVLAVAHGLADRSLYALAIDAIAQNFALSASGDGLDYIGAEYGLARDPATAWRGTATLAADDGTTIPSATVFVGPQGLQYLTQAAVTAPVGASGSGVVLDLLCIQEGAAGNLSAGDELQIQSPIAGASRIATVSSVTATGTEEADDDDYRQIILDAERSEGGGGNSSDIRSWAQGVTGVRRAYPFTGPYIGSGLTPYPGMRTVYVEALASIDADGIAPAGLLTSVKAVILADPDTLVPREILGLTEDTLYVQSIARIPIYIDVVGLTVRTGTIGAAQSAVTEAADIFLRRFAPFVQGLDPDFERLDDVTASNLGREIQEVLNSFGGSSQNVLLGTSPGTYLGHYELAQNQRLKLGGITFSSGA